MIHFKIFIKKIEEIYHILFTKKTENILKEVNETINKYNFLHSFINK